VAPRLLAQGDPELAPRADLAFAVRHLASYAPLDPAQRAERDRVLAFCAEHGDALHRSSLAGHLTASALLVDHAGERALLTLHRKLGKWLQLGGHCDGDANLPAVALREASEESGIASLRVDPRPIDVDVHVIPAYGDVPEHLHLDTSYVVRAPAGAVPVKSDESHELAWFTAADVERENLEPSLRRLFRAAGLGAR
jgi:8-oxo-dGTP pyrophosphatase MutT (NUDIX family)